MFLAAEGIFLVSVPNCILFIQNLIFWVDLLWQRVALGCLCLPPDLAILNIKMHLAMKTFKLDATGFERTMSVTLVLEFSSYCLFIPRLVFFKHRLHINVMVDTSSAISLQYLGIQVVICTAQIWLIMYLQYILRNFNFFVVSICTHPRCMLMQTERKCVPSEQTQMDAPAKETVVKDCQWILQQSLETSGLARSFFLLG